jgi:hypothetical protein
MRVWVADREAEYARRLDEVEYDRDRLRVQLLDSQTARIESLQWQLDQTVAVDGNDPLIVDEWGVRCYESETVGPEGNCP